MDSNVKPLEIRSGQTWSYKGLTPKHGKVGDEYVVTGTCKMKAKSGGEWVDGVNYMRLTKEGQIAIDDEPNTFCRDEEGFREKFEFVPK